MNKLKIKRNIGIGLSCIMMLSLCGCAENANISQRKSVEPSSGTMQSVGSYATSEEYAYTNEGVKEAKTGTYTTENQLCCINIYPSYYDVTLDYEKGSRHDVGAAYAKAIKVVAPQYEETMEPYIFENIRIAFSGQNVDMEALEKRMNALLQSIDEEYQEEIKGFAEEMAKISADESQVATSEPEVEHGFTENGKLSYEEAIIVQMVPDALRGTACSGLSLWGDKTVTGKKITLRCLEWNLGSENQMCTIHAVVHMKNKDKSITSINMLGLLDILSAVNDDGVFVGILDVGSKEASPFVYEGKTCYTYAIKEALEHYDNATDVGNYMVKLSGDFTWCHNLIITDAKNSYCAEDCVKEVSDAGMGYSILRDENSPLMPGLTWNCEDSLCVLNSFATKGNQDQYSRSTSNIVRFEKYNNWVAEKEKFSVADVKELITQEKTDQYEITNVHSNCTVHLVLIDYATGNIQVAFTGVNGVTDKPEFVDVGNY